jgi:hypothetical protein
MIAARNQYEGWMSKRLSRSNLSQSPNVIPPRMLGPNHSKKRLRHDMIKPFWMIGAARLPRFPSEPIIHCDTVRRGRFGPRLSRAAILPKSTAGEVKQLSVEAKGSDDKAPIIRLAVHSCLTLDWAADSQPP